MAERTYDDGTVASGPAPLPALSPRTQDLLERAQKFADEVWHDALSKEDREGEAFNLRCAIREYLTRGVSASYQQTESQQTPMDSGKAGA